MWMADVIFENIFYLIIVKWMNHRDNAFMIKVGDLLRNVGKLDTVHFNNLMIEDIHGLSPEWVSGVLTIQWVADGSVKVIIKQAHAMVLDICDLSGEEYPRQVEVRNFDARFSMELQSDDDDRVYDELFPLDNNGEVINIYDLLLQSIRIQEPILHIKPGKEYLFDEFSSGEEDDDEQAVWNVIFR